MIYQPIIIAYVFDFDKTLSPVYMQKVIFDHFEVDEKQFWIEKEAYKRECISRGINLDDEHAYLNLMLERVENGQFPGLSNQLMRDLGANLPLYDGLPEFFPWMKEQYHSEFSAEVKVEFYVDTSGIKPLVEGSPLGKSLDGIFACEFDEKDGVISRIAHTVDFSRKRSFLHEINKETNFNPLIGVNDKVPRQYRRVPFENLCYTGDGANDIVCFNAMTGSGGHAHTIYQRGNKQSISSALQLVKDKRVHTIGPDDYLPNSHTSDILLHWGLLRAEQVLKQRKSELEDALSKGPGY